MFFLYEFILDCKKEYVRILQPEGLGEAINANAKAVVTYNGVTMKTEEDMLYLYAWWQLLLPFSARRKKNLSGDGQNSHIPEKFSRLDEKDNRVMRFIGLYVRSKHLRRFITLLSPFIYIPRELIRFPVNLFRLCVTELPSSLLALLFKHLVIAVKSKMNDCDNRFNLYLGYPLLWATFSGLRLFFNFTLMIGRGITSVHRGPGMAYHDTIRYFSEKAPSTYEKRDGEKEKEKEGKQDKTSTFNNHNTSLDYYEKKYRKLSSRNQIIIFYLANMSRVITFFTMIFVWTNLVSLINPSAIIFPLLPHFAQAALGLIAHLTATPISAFISLMTALATASVYKFVRSCWNQLTNVFIANTEDRLMKMLFKNSLVECLILFNAYYPRTYTIFSEKKNQPDTDILVNRNCNATFFSPRTRSTPNYESQKDNSTPPYTRPA